LGAFVVYKSEEKWEKKGVCEEGRRERLGFVGGGIGEFE